jgi:hypothetical protein
MKKLFALSLVGALAAGAALVATPQEANAQVRFSVGFGTGYYGSGWGWGGPRYYDRIGYSPFHHRGYYGGYYPRTRVTYVVRQRPTYYYAPVVQRRVVRRVVSTPIYYVPQRRIVRTRVVRSRPVVRVRSFESRPARVVVRRSYY